MAFGTPVRRKPDEDQRIMPLINVVFLLLIFFMVAGHLAKMEAINVEPPISDSDLESKDDPVSLSVGADGRVSMAGQEIDSADITGLLKDVFKDSPTRSVQVKADAAADVTQVLRVLEQVKAGKAEQVQLLTQTRREP